MDRNPAKRFQTAGEFLRALDGVGKASLVSAAVASAPARRPRLLKIGVAVATLAVALLIAASLAMGVFRGTPAPAATIRATPPIAAPALPVPSEVKAQQSEPALVEPPAPAPAPPALAPPPAAPSHSQASVRPHKPAPAPAAESTASAPVEPPQADAPDDSAVAPAPDDKPAAPAKKGFWRKVNPFKKRN